MRGAFPGWFAYVTLNSFSTCYIFPSILYFSLLLSSAINSHIFLLTDQNTTAFKEVAIIRHPRHGEYAFGFITSSLILQVKLALPIQ